MKRKRTAAPGKPGKPAKQVRPVEQPAVELDDRRWARLQARGVSTGGSGVLGALGSVFSPAQAHTVEAERHNEAMRVDDQEKGEFERRLYGGKITLPGKRDDA